MIHPLYRDGEYQGAAAVYLNENDWTKLFSQYQYDAILTKSNGDVIACSNSSFLSQKNANKYLPADAAQYVRVNGNRYLRSSRSLETARCWLTPSSTRPRITVISWWVCS